MPKRQLERREQAVQLYRKIGSISGVSREPGMPRTPTLFRWAKEDRWEERNKEIQNQVSKYVEAIEIAKRDTHVKEDLQEMEFLKMLEKIVAEKIISGEVLPRTWREVIETLKFINEEKRLLTGRPTSRTEVYASYRSLEEGELDVRIKEILTIISGGEGATPDDAGGAVGGKGKK